MEAVQDNINTTCKGSFIVNGFVNTDPVITSRFIHVPLPPKKEVPCSSFLNGFVNPDPAILSRFIYLPLPLKKNNNP
jgi:hypothetical protein